MTFYIPKKALLMCATRLRAQDVFTTFLINAGSNGQVVNGQNWQTSGGLVWAKARQRASDHYLLDASRNNNLSLSSNLTSAEANINQSITPRVDGFSFTNLAQAGENNVLWSFRRAKKFFDIVTYTGNGQSGRQIPHGLGDVPGMVIIKRRSAADDWIVRHRAATGELFLNVTNAQDPSFSLITASSATTFTVNPGVNTNGTTFVAYLFAHNPDLIQCTSFVQQSTDTTINLGWKPQFVLWKNISAAGPWYMADTARGWDTSATKYLRSNVSDAESNESPTYSYPTATGVVSKPNNFPTGNTIAGLFIRSPT